MLFAARPSAAVRGFSALLSIIFVFGLGATVPPQASAAGNTALQLTTHVLRHLR